MKTPLPNSFIEIDLDAFRSNLRRIRSVLRPGARILLVVKSEAYGHGMIPIARAAAGFREIVYFGVSSIGEAVRLRQAGIRKPILVLGVLHPRDIKEAIRLGLTASVSSLEEAKRLGREARRMHRRAKVHVELDTGMGRLGVWCAEAIWLLYKVHEVQGLDLEGVFSHFPSADEDDPVFSLRQIEIFDKAVDIAGELFKRPLKYIHMANSAGLLTYRDSHFSLVRPGIMAYGVYPGRAHDIKTLRPILSLRSRVAFLKTVDKGRTVSYGRTYAAPQRTRIATIPIGYSSGYPFYLSNRSHVVIRGRKFPVVGRVTMDHIMADVGTELPILPWDPVTLIGKDGAEEVGVEELAKLAGTIPYVILTGLSPSLPRIYKSAA